MSTPKTIAPSSLADIFLVHQGCGYGFAPSMHVFGTTFLHFLFLVTSNIGPGAFFFCFFRVEGATKGMMTCFVPNLKGWEKDGKKAVKGIGGQNLRNKSIDGATACPVVGAALSIRLEHREGFQLRSPMKFIEMERQDW